MTVTNPHPLANPLNQARFRNFAYGQQQSNSFSISKPTSPRDLTVPEPRPYDPDAYARLTVPNSDIPYYDGPVPMSGFLGNSALFKLADGSVLDMKSCKIVYDPNKKWLARGYWNDPNAETKKPSAEIEWGPNETIESMLARIGTQPDGSYNDPNLSPESIAYWKKADEESRKLEQNLTDEQKKLLADLHAGKMFTPSRLVEET